MPRSGDVGAFVLRRIAVSIPLLLAVSLVVFLLGRLVPGDPVRLFLTANNVNDPDRIHPPGVELRVTANS